MSLCQRKKARGENTACKSSASQKDHSSSAPLAKESRVNIFDERDHANGEMDSVRAFQRNTQMTGSSDYQFAGHDSFKTSASNRTTGISTTFVGNTYTIHPHVLLLSGKLMPRMLSFCFSPFSLPSPVIKGSAEKGLIDSQGSRKVYTDSKSLLSLQEDGELTMLMDDLNFHMDGLNSINDNVKVRTIRSNVHGLENFCSNKDHVSVLRQSKVARSIVNCCKVVLSREDVCQDSETAKSVAKVSRTHGEEDACVLSFELPYLLFFSLSLSLSLSLPPSSSSSPLWSTDIPGHHHEHSQGSCRSFQGNTLVPHISAEATQE